MRKIVATLFIILFMISCKKRETDITVVSCSLSSFPASNTNHPKANEFRKL
jgi:hypothetical protein